ncbi:ArsR family transcriptional regulator [Candidatus Bathyarchaeota archaeon]|nr:ArsR family transcriptional regulator [Candidatus Bathyarchaeota archaeon]
MLLRIIRDLASEEVVERIRQFEKEFGMSFEEFKEKQSGQKLETTLGRVYFEWAELVNSYKGYIEEGQVDYSIEEIRNLTPEQIALLTPKRIELLYQLASTRVESINDLAKKVRRNIKNVHQDIQILRKLGFVKTTKRRGKALVPETLIREMTLLIR